MGSENTGPLPNPDAQSQEVPVRSSSSLGDEDTQPKRQPQATDLNSPSVDIEPSYREHSSVSGELRPPQAPQAHPAQPSYQQLQSNQPQLPMSSYSGWQPYQPPPFAQSWQPPYPTTPPMPSYPGWQPPYQPPNLAQPWQPSYPTTPPVSSYPPASYPPATPYPHDSSGYGYPQTAPSDPPRYHSFPPAYPHQVWQPPRPRRDGYQLGVAIISTICSSLALLAGLTCGLILLFLVIAPPNLSRLGPNARFSATVIYTALTIIGLASGSFSLYHSIRALLQKPSAPFKLPWSWLFLAFYIVLLAIGFTVGTVPEVLANKPLKIFLIVLAGIFPALIFLALAVRRIHYPRQAPWTTTWRRFTLAIINGGTVTVLLAVFFELVLNHIAGNAFEINTSVIDNPSMPVPHNIQQLLFLLVLVSIIAPIIEECVKPLAVEVLIGRLHSAAEAFVLGFACGIGFDLIETSGYISLSDSHPWVYTALERSTAGLLHGFGAGMVALGCYYLTHRTSINNHVLIGLGCITYAIIQHAIWNGAFVFAFLPAPIGPFIENGTIPIGTYTMQGIVVVYIIESLLIFAFFLFVTRKLRSQQASKAAPQGTEMVTQAGNPAHVSRFQ